MFRLVADPTLRAARVVGCSGAGPYHWNLVIGGGRAVNVSHNWVQATGVKVGDYLVHKDGEWVGAVKPDVFEAMFALIKRAEPPADVPFLQRFAGRGR
jgi:hypothetical protein